MELNKECLEIGIMDIDTAITNLYDLRNIIDDCLYDRYSVAGLQERLGEIDSSIQRLMSLQDYLKELWEPMQ